jgi:hypothetical protein
MSQCKTRDKDLELPKYPRKHRVDAVANNGKQERDGEPSSESSDGHEFYVCSTETTVDKSDPWILPLEVNNSIVTFKVDTGSDVNVMSYNELLLLLLLKLIYKQ